MDECWNLLVECLVVVRSPWTVAVVVGSSPSSGWDEVPEGGVESSDKTGGIREVEGGGSCFVDLSVSALTLSKMTRLTIWACCLEIDLGKAFAWGGGLGD